jgi:hypothetical protein
MTNWIKSLAEQAIKENWCVQSGCTTCGSLVFRSSLIKRCFQNNNVAFPNNIKPSKYRSQNPILVDLFPTDINFCVKAISKELANLNNEDIDEIIKPATLRLIFSEIYGRNYIKLIKDTLSDSPAGKYLISMEAHSKYVDEQRRKHEIDHSPEMVTEKRRKKKELKAKVHAERVAKYKRLSFKKNK